MLSADKRFGSLHTSVVKGLPASFAKYCSDVHSCHRDDGLDFGRKVAQIRLIGCERLSLGNTNSISLTSRFGKVLVS